MPRRLSFARIASCAVIAAGTADEILANPEVRAVYLGENFRM